MIPAVFIAGTDTGIGKTAVSCGLLRLLSGRGYTAIGMKPVATGAYDTAEGPRNDDAIQLLKHSQPVLDYSTVNPFIFSAPASPNIAARHTAAEVTLAAIGTAYADCRRAADLVLVEGIGGWRVPLSETLQTVDLVRHLDLPVILICGLRLGCINHALLSAEAIAADGVRLLGWVANEVDPDYAYTAATIDTLEARMPAPLLGITPWQDPVDPDMIAQGLEVGTRPWWSDNAD